MLRHSHIAALALAVAALAAGGCGDDDDEPAAASEKETSTQTKTRDFPVQADFPLTPGIDYTTTRFTPPLTLRVESGAWRTDFPEDSDIASMALVADESFNLAGVGVHRIEKVADPEKGAVTVSDAVDAPDDYIQWLADHPRLKASEPKEVTVDGRKGRQIEVTPKSFPKKQPVPCKTEPPNLPCVVLYFAGAEPFWYYESGRVRFTGIDVGDEQIVIEQLVDPKERFDEIASEHLDAVVESMRFSD